jgi:hypothetical protein
MGKVVQYSFILLLGVFTGAASGYVMNFIIAAPGDYFQGHSMLFEFTIPGGLFGLAVCTLYVWKATPLLDMRAILKVIQIILAGVFSYFAACNIVFFFLLDNLEASVIGFIGGGVGTILFLLGLAMITRAYSIKAILASVICGAILSAYLTPLLFPVSSDNYQGIYIFFIGWQAIMLVVISIPLLELPRK